MNIDFSLVGKRIQKMRKKKGMSRSQLAARIGISEGHIGHVETGNKTPSAEMLINIAVALNITVDDLLIDLNILPKKNREMNDLFRDCSESEKTIFKEIIIFTKSLLKKYDF